MKKLLLFIFSALLLGSLFTVNTSPAGAATRNPNCLNLYGKFSASNWKSGTIMVGCSGNTRALGCKGGIVTIKPGQSFNLPNCTCPPYAKGCLIIGKELKITKVADPKHKTTINKVVVVKPLPASCKLTTKLACGRNGQRINNDFKVACNRPSASPTPSPTSTPTPTPTPSPSICVGPKQVTNVKVSCPDCFSEKDIEDANKKSEEEGGL